MRHLGAKSLGVEVVALAAVRGRFALNSRSHCDYFFTMRCHSRLVVTTLLAVAFGSPNLRGQGGIVLEKPYPWSPSTEVVSVKEFFRESRRRELEDAYQEYFIASDGKRFSIEHAKIADVIFYPDLTIYTDIQSEAQLSPILAGITELKASAVRYRLAKPYLDRQIAKLQNEVSLFQQGARKIGGTWHSAAEIARQRQEAAEHEAKLEAARKAEEERLAKIRADEERTAMERKAAADAALAKRIGNFKSDTTDFLAKMSLPPGDFHELNTLEDVKELPAATQEKIEAMVEKIRNLRKEENSEELVKACQAEISAVSAFETRSKAARDIRARNAAAALAEANSFLQNNPSPPSDGQKELWKSLASIRALCNRLESEAKPHFEKAQSLSSSGKAGDAIQEFQIAYRIFPDPKVADAIRQLRENSLGL